MSQGELTKIMAKTAAEVAGRSEPGDEARALLADGLAPSEYLEILIEKRLHRDAIRFLAFALPKREAVWWACLCAERVLGPEPPPAAAGALQAAKAWVIDPKDENRRGAFPAAEAAEIGTPAGCAAVAAYFSGGSLAPPNVQAVPPGEHLTAHMVASSLALAAVIKEPEKSAEKLAAFLQLGLEIAQGQHGWPEPPSPRPTTPTRPAPGAPSHGDARRARR